MLGLWNSKVFNFHRRNFDNIYFVVRSDNKKDMLTSNYYIEIEKKIEVGLNLTHCMWIAHLSSFLSNLASQKLEIHAPLPENL